MRLSRGGMGERLTCKEAFKLSFSSLLAFNFYTVTMVHGCFKNRSILWHCVRGNVSTLPVAKHIRLCLMMCRCLGISPIWQTHISFALADSSGTPPVQTDFHPSWSMPANPNCLSNMKLICNDWQRSVTRPDLKSHVKHFTALIGCRSAS